MKTRAVAATAGTVAAVVLLAASFFGFSTACACVSSAEIVASAAGLSTTDLPAEDLTAAEVEAGLRARFVGRRPDPRAVFPSRDVGCTDDGKGSTQCYVPTHRSWLLARGWLVRLRQQPDGTIVSVDVESSRRWVL
jgi:hypothetical protein